MVFDEDVFNLAFADLVGTNSEGRVVSSVDASGRTRGLPFTEPAIAELVGSGSMSPAAVACLRLAWTDRHVLFG